MEDCLGLPLVSLQSADKVVPLTTRLLQDSEKAMELIEVIIDRIKYNFREVVCIYIYILIHSNEVECSLRIHKGAYSVGGHERSFKRH